MLLPHHPEALHQLRRPTEADPLRVLISGCLAGHPCGVDGTDNGLAESLQPWILLPTVRTFAFCPEAYALGTPRTMPDIHRGDGRAVLAGKAQVLDEHGKDLTSKMLEGAHAMLQFAKHHQIELCVLTDASAACGSQVISDGCRLVEIRKYHKGLGVAAALLDREGFLILSQRDYRSLGHLRKWLLPDFVPDPQAIDHHEHPWCKQYFGESELGRYREA